MEQAQQLRKKLLYLEGIIAWNTCEYIWRVIVGPQDRMLLERFVIWSICLFLSTPGRFYNLSEEKSFPSIFS